MKLKLLIIMGFLSSSLFADVKLEPVFGDNMVLQRNTSVNFWGTADSGEKVTISGSWGNSAEATADAYGKWKLQIKTPDAGGPFTVDIQGKNKITFKNVMSGEVWLCTGQSNMDCHMAFFKDTKEAIANSDYPDIRFFVVGKKSSNIPLETLKGSWALCTPKTTAGFSATGYFFGLKLYKELNIPIGLIECAWGGTRVEAWIPWEKQKDNPRLVRERENAAKQAEVYNEVEERKIYNEAKEKYKVALKAWNESDKKAPCPRHYRRFKQHPLKHANYSSNLYNGMTSPLIPYTVKGGVWYQGESNAGHANEYADQLGVMITSWREKWGQGDFPFYVVQLPGYKKAWTTPVEEGASWALMREAFAAFAKNVPNTGMAITIDIGEASDIHPQQKSKVGERLARLALYKDYGKKDVVWTGPIMQSCEFKDGKAVIKFETGGSPLAVRNNEEIKGFALCDDNGEFIEADAKIIGDDTVEVISEKVKIPTIVYYAWAYNPEGVNLINKEGLPASPFRYGKKPEINLLQNLMPDVEKEYELVYDINPKSARCKGGTQFVYKKDNSDKIKGPFKKVAYFLALRNKAGKTEYVFAEMDPFTDDVKKIGVPDKASGAYFQCPVKNVKVKSNVPEIKTGDFPEGCNIEFWDCNYGGGNAKKVPGATNKHDFGDSVSTSVSPGYGSMQIHNNREKQSIICFNNFRAGANADVGIGNSDTEKAQDWTFTKNANKCSVAELKVLVKTCSKRSNKLP